VLGAARLRDESRSLRRHRERFGFILDQAYRAAYHSYEASFLISDGGVAAYLSDHTPASVRAAVEAFRAIGAPRLADALERSLASALALHEARDWTPERAAGDCAQLNVPGTRRTGNGHRSTPSKELSTMVRIDEIEAGTPSWMIGQRARSPEGGGQAVTQARVRFHRAARVEAEAAARWYEERGEGLGDDFVVAVQRAVQKIADARIVDR
jgi:hypothetical protein